MSDGLTLRFTRLSPTHHGFEYRRADGTGETVEVETDDFLLHDLLRYAVESEAGLRGSFYGILGKIGGYEELVVAGGAALGGEIAITERVVGALSDAMQYDLDDEAFVAEVRESLQLYAEPPPRWLTPALAIAARGHVRQLAARWKATPIGKTMELEFPHLGPSLKGRDGVGGSLTPASRKLREPPPLAPPLEEEGNSG